MEKCYILLLQVYCIHRTPCACADDVRFGRRGVSGRMLLVIIKLKECYTKGN